MADERTLHVLNQLLAIHHRSLPVYLQSAPPWTRRRGEPEVEIIRDIARAHEAMVDRIGSLILQMDGVVRYGSFPMIYADWHDLSIQFLLSHVVERQEWDLARIQHCVAQLEGAPRARALAEEALGEAKGHLETLEEVVAEPAAA